MHAHDDGTQASNNMATRAPEWCPPGLKLMAGWGSRLFGGEMEILGDPRSPSLSKLEIEPLQGSETPLTIMA